MRNRIYLLWRDAELGAAEDNYVAVTGEEFFRVMNDKAQGRYYSCLREREPQDMWSGDSYDIYIETTQEESVIDKRADNYANYRYADRKRFVKEEGTKIIWLDAQVDEDDSDGMTQEEQCAGPENLEDWVEAHAVGQVLQGLYESMDPAEQYLYDHCVLCQRSMTLDAVARTLEVSTTTAWRRILRVQERVYGALQEFDPEIVRKYLYQGEKSGHPIQQ